MNETGTAGTHNTLVAAVSAVAIAACLLFSAGCDWSDWLPVPVPPTGPGGQVLHECWNDDVQPREDGQ